MAKCLAKKVCIIGSGNWGSAIAKIVGKNCKRLDKFFTRVNMYVYEEMVDGRKLTEIINQEHENVKYLPGHKLGDNIVAVPNLLDASRDADMFIFVVPHQFIGHLCKQMKGNIKPDAIGISLIKGVDHTDKGLKLISDIIHEILSVDVSVLMGANLAPEVAEEMFCETTIGCHIPENGALFKDLLQSENFRICVVGDPKTVEICGALKNIVACGAGFVDGLGLGDNTKAAVIRLGLMEMIKFANVFFKDSKDPPQMSTFMESCGVADLVTTCYGGRNRRLSEQFVKTGRPIDELENEMLNGQKLQGPETAQEVMKVLKAQNIDPERHEVMGKTRPTSIKWYGGRSRAISDVIAATGETLQKLEKELLNGQSAQGPIVVKEVVEALRSVDQNEKDFPLFFGVYQVFYEGKHPGKLVKLLQDHPVHR